MLFLLSRRERRRRSRRLNQRKTHRYRPNSVREKVRGESAACAVKKPKSASIVCLRSEKSIWSYCLLDNIVCLLFLLFPRRYKCDPDDNGAAGVLEKGS